ncbi:MAG TPA: family 78 glycoside hydrolase catalytic domain, partial [Armatimonadota bacterium]|nr:family 78 glycoside hydrolase catalytic domain [Armatimonadota bacterium]
ERLGSSQDWKTLSTWDVTGKLGPGANVVAAEATNADGPAAFVAGLLIRYEDGQTQAITTSEGWRTAADAEGEWATAGYDDSAWVPPVVVAQWGAAPYGTPGQGGGGRNLRSQCFRKEFRLDQPVTSARAYVSGLGLYELRINGRKVGADELAPGWTLYDKRVQYQTFDVTDLLRSGRNAVGAVVGNGWWSGRISWRTPPPGVRNVLRFVCELDVELANGEHVLVATDDSWRAHESPVLSDDLYDGETYDARLAMPGWDQPGFDDREWRPTAIIADDIGRLVAQRGPAIRCTHALAPKAITEPSPGVFVFDFGQNLAGRERLRVKGPAGTAVRIRFAEVLNPDGSIYTENYRSAKATDTYILRGDGEETWAPRFTYRGFRYAEVTGFPGKPAADALTAEAVHSDAPVIGRFECSEPLLNQIQHNIVWGQRSNMHSVPTDCPQRDERLGWTGDAQAFAPTACWNMDMASFFAKWMLDLRDSQGPGGEVADIAPVGAPSAGSPAWADVITIVPWNVFRFYGDARLVDTSFDSMRGWVEYMRRHAPNHLYEREGYGDWIAPVGTAKKPIGTAYYYLSARRLAEMAAARGRDLDAKQYLALADDIARAFNEAYLAPDGNYPGGTQTANLLPLAFGITPADRRAEVAAHIAQDVRGRNEHLSTGFLGTAFLLPVLSDMGYHDLAYRVATQRTYPSWGYMVEKGATTIWELWNSDTEGPGMNSRNHFALGGVGEWFYEYLAGIRPDADHPGFEHFTVWPRPVAGLAWAKADYNSPHGRIRSAWRLDGDRLVMDVEVPANTTATIHVPTTDVSRIREGGRVSSPRAGLTYRGESSGAAIFDAVARRYHLETPWAPASSP